MSESYYAYTKLMDDPEVFPLEGTITDDVLDNLLEGATDAGASDINFCTDQICRISKYGILRPFTKKATSGPDTDRILRAIFGDMGPGLLNGGRDVDGSFEIRPRGNREYPLRFRYNALRGRNATQITMRTLPSMPPLLEKMNVPAPIVANLRPKSGLVYVSGPTGSGKSTLLSAAIRYLVTLPDRPEDGFTNSGKLCFYERPVEFIYDDLLHLPRFLIHQVEVGRDLRPPGDKHTEGEEWAYAVRSALRRTPDIAIVGEARDAATIKGCIELGLSGHLTYATIHAIGVAETIRRATIAFPSNERQGAAVDLLDMLHMVVTQILVPKVGGGRQPVREYALFNQSVKSALLKLPVDAWPEKIRELMAEGRMENETLIQCADRLLAEGLISQEERNKCAARQKISWDDALNVMENKKHLEAVVQA